MMFLTVPITLDYPWPAAASLLAVVVLVATWLPYSVAMTPARIAAAVLFLSTTIWTGAYLATWSARIDRQGVAVAAPVDLFRHGGIMSWREIATATIDRRADHFRSWRLALRSFSGRTLEIPLSNLPGPEAAAVAQLVAERAIYAELTPDPDGFLRKAQRIAAHKGPWLALMRLHAPPQITANIEQ